MFGKKTTTIGKKKKKWITKQTLRIAGETELGPLQEKRGTLDAIGRPMSVLEGLIFALGTLQNQNVLGPKKKKLWP